MEKEFKAEYLVKSPKVAYSLEQVMSMRTSQGWTLVSYTVLKHDIINKDRTFVDDLVVSILWSRNKDA